MDDLHGSLRSLKLRIFAEQQLSTFPAAAPTGYLLVLLYALEAEQFLELVTFWVPALFAVFGVIGPWAFIHFLVERGLRRSPDDAPGDHFRRILLLPRRLEVGALTCYVSGGAALTASACLSYGRSLVLLGPAVLVCLAFVLLLSVRLRMKMEALLRPLVLEELRRHPGARPGAPGFPSLPQVWYRPYVFLLAILATLVSLGVLLVRRLETFLDGLGGELRLRGLDQFAAELPDWGQRLLTSILAPLAIILGFTLLLGVFSARAVARRQRAGAQALEEAGRAIASGAYELPRWLATDELGDLAFATAAAICGLQRKSDAIASSARTMEEVARDLAALVARQREVINTQASVLRQTQAIAQEIKQTVGLASEDADRVVAKSENAGQVGRSGGTAVESSLEELRDILTQVQEMASRLETLRERARTIGRITMVVKDLADESNMVALNAAIEATRAGENARTFSSVAQQIRRLGEESMDATGRVQQVLQTLETAIRETLRLSAGGIDRAGSGLELTRACGENIRSLNEIVQGNASAARQISAAVTQQGAGISQIIEALTMLGGTTEETAVSMQATEAITLRARRAAQEVAGAMARDPRPPEPSP